MQGTRSGGRRHLALGAVLVLTVLVAGIYVAPAWADADVEMVEGSATDITSWGFNPPEVTIQAGQAVTFHNTGTQAHTATGTNNAFDTGLIPPGESKTLAMASAGSYAFICTPHPWMKGTIIVTAAAAAPAAAPAAQAAATPTPGAAVAAQPVAKPAAQAVPTPTPFRLVTAPTTATSPASTAPRAGGLPMELVLPLLVGGGSATAAGATLLLRSRRRR